MQPDKPNSTRVVHLNNPALSPAALKAVLVFLYTERLDVGIEEVEAVLKVLRKCRLKRMVACVMKERRTLRYYFKSTRKDEAGPRRFGQPYAVVMRVHLWKSSVLCGPCLDSSSLCNFSLSASKALLF